jgi:hypothetical protein
MNALGLFAAPAGYALWSERFGGEAGAARSQEGT